MTQFQLRTNAKMMISHKLGIVLSFNNTRTVPSISSVLLSHSHFYCLSLLIFYSILLFLIFHFPFHLSKHLWSIELLLVYTPIREYKSSWITHTSILSFRTQRYCQKRIFFSITISWQRNTLVLTTLQCSYNCSISNSHRFFKYCVKNGRVTSIEWIPWKSSVQCYTKDFFCCSFSLFLKRKKNS